MTSLFVKSTLYQVVSWPGGSVYPPTPADARGSALGNNTFDPGFGLVPLLYSIG